MSATKKAPKQNLLLSLVMGFGVLSLAMSQSAKADVSVDGGQRTYGYIEVIGTPSMMQYSGYDAHLTTIGSSTNDDGEFDFTLNKKERLPTGSYRLHYSDTYTDVDVTAGAVKVVKLQKVSIKNPRNITSVTLSNDDTGNQIGEWDPTQQKSTGRQINCHSNLQNPADMPMIAPLIILSDANPFNYHEDCDTEYRTITNPPSTAYFLVFPGTYTMTFNYTDGTSHSKEGIVVR